MSEFPFIMRGGSIVRLAGYHSRIEGAAQQELTMPLGPGDQESILAQLSEQNGGQSFSFNEKNQLCDANGSPIDERIVARLIVTVH